ncbi:MAG: hypothetical protein KAX84_02265 [Burkholderiales bacterium]|nr:hypothetical protein [Burkholderiales bacterium]
MRPQAAALPPIRVANTVTQLGPEDRGAVLVAGSHGGLIAAHLAARGGAHAAIFNDAGVGCDNAGIAGLDLLGAIGMAAATVSHLSARIADGADGLAHGVISHVNAPAAACGVHAGQRCRDAGECLRRAPAPQGEPLPYPEGRFALLPRSVAKGLPAVWGLDSIGKVLPGDAGRILIIGSHGGLHGGDPDSALPVAAAAAIFHDAGRGKDGASLTRLPVLAGRGMPAGVVDYRSARIGDARSMWETGWISAWNAPAAERGLRVGIAVREAVTLLRRGT